MKLIKISAQMSKGVHFRAGKVAVAYRDGRLTFAGEAVLFCGMNSTTQGALVFTSDEDENIYFQILPTKDEHAFKLGRRGKQYAFGSALLMNELKIDYKNKRIRFAVSDHWQDGEKFFKLTKIETAEYGTGKILKGEHVQHGKKMK